MEEVEPSSWRWSHHRGGGGVEPSTTEVVFVVDGGGWTVRCASVCGRRRSRRWAVEVGQRWSMN
ncbi:hypothetical protein OSB04_010797 [Centaurea solstitialis]|uniref:Uncharacterized protein n=1 Tax=Centaurea solstitialis TaxID=347529 RepID=A0AA38T890_9ASTR|nr:hypothetical protein OSB04_010797 [Centaurea solstitialis]